MWNQGDMEQDIAWFGLQGPTWKIQLILACQELPLICPGSPGLYAFLVEQKHSFFPVPKAEIAPDPKKFPVFKAARTASGGHLSAVTKTFRLCSFLPVEKNCSSRSISQNWDLASQILSIQGLLPGKSSQNREMWLALLLWRLF